MSAEYLVLAYFKSNKIQYYYNKPIVHFPCPYCRKEANMNAVTAVWICNKCGKNGTLVNLVLMNKNDLRELKEIDIVNPRKIIREMLWQLDQAIELSNEKQVINLLETVKNKINSLRDYFNDKTGS